ncbi:MAG: hypothetical protein HQL40_17875 [Alphaproteobacteria bacterium]|nr:hypothetical protein [Alphaproteobacteria bacterium]
MLKTLVLAAIIASAYSTASAGASYEAMSMAFCNARADQYTTKSNQQTGQWHKCTEAENAAKARLSGMQTSERVNRICTPLSTYGGTFSYAAFENCINSMR